MNYTKSSTFLKHEVIQMYLRFAFVFIATTAIFIDYYMYNSMNEVSFEYMITFPLLFLFVSIIHAVILYKYPNFYQLQRIRMMSILEVIAVAYVMYLAGELSLYFPFLFLWFIVGYSIRYGTNFGYITYVTSIISWSLLLIYSDFWNEHLKMGLGWFIAFVLIPLYFFKLLNKLHENIEKFEYLANHDALTSLANRSLFDVTLEKYIDEHEKSQEKFALIFIDLDDFKKINDVHGHLMGDTVLKEVSKRITQVYPFVSRLGGDEFVAITKYEDEITLVSSLDNLVKILSSDCISKEVHISASIGISLFLKDATLGHDLKKKADKAMYHAKKNGKNTYSFYEESM